MDAARVGSDMADAMVRTSANKKNNFTILLALIYFFMWFLPFGVSFVLLILL
ncbi:MAG: hypothetical protein RHS_5645 [Robinsoniella sp. RHS]|nr:MAG: hypothetical protein RHS_5645 [Robinsoniella sp. RHS]